MFTITLGIYLVKYGFIIMIIDYNTNFFKKKFSQSTLFYRFLFPLYSVHPTINDFHLRIFVQNVELIIYLSQLSRFSMFLGCKNFYFLFYGKILQTKYRRNKILNKKKAFLRYLFSIHTESKKNQNRNVVELTASSLCSEFRTFWCPKESCQDNGKTVKM